MHSKLAQHNYKSSAEAQPIALNERLHSNHTLQEAQHSYAVGHMAIAYLLSKPAAKLLKTNISLPLILVLSVIPDIDILLIPQLHRGPTHSVLTALFIFVPIFAIYRKKATPYFLALVSHGLIGDFMGGQVMLFWPVSQAEFGLHELGSYYIGITSPINVALELILFIAASAVLLVSRDFRQFFQNKKINLILVVPAGTVLLPPLLTYPIGVPSLLVPPHILLLVIFAISVFIALVGLVRKRDIARKPN